MKRLYFFCAFYFLLTLPAWADNQQSSNGFSLFALFNLGGPFMWLLLGFAILSLAYILERLWHFSQHKFKVEKDARHFIENFQNGERSQELERLARAHPKNDLMQILVFANARRREGYDKLEKIIASKLGVVIARLERGLNVLSSIGSLAPLTGFLGTVSGMINAFRTIANADQVNARMVAGGIFEALITTAFGLLIAIVTVSAYNYFVHKIGNFTKNCEELANAFLENLD
ncbi:MotA/TolQ/ExbB proton channel family protein [candidate division FCPU426 bacterium]|nr:MotA/TolQ/ExbB proton channel family protein [candidate division FCPU426 bacterium]